MRKNNKHFQNV